jgi:hypothetical protein
VILGQQVEKPAGLKVLQRDVVAVDQHHRCAGAALDVGAARTAAEGSIR